MKTYERGTKKYFYAVSKLVEIGEGLIGKIAQSTKLTIDDSILNQRRMQPHHVITDYIVEERIQEPRLFICFGSFVVPWETIWDAKNKPH